MGLLDLIVGLWAMSALLVMVVGVYNGDLSMIAIGGVGVAVVFGYYFFGGYRSIPAGSEPAND